MSITEVTGGWSEVIVASNALTTMSTLQSDCGNEIHLDPSRWHDVADETDLDVLARVTGPVLDVGSGPGRLVVALADLGVEGLGIDVCPLVVGLAQDRGAATIRGDIFGEVPGVGQWATALLLDGNIGIGGDPERLLGRLAEIASPHGSAVVELAATGARTRGRRVRVVHPGGETAWFPWAVVTVDELPGYASRSGWLVTETWCSGGRWFSLLKRTNAGSA